MNAQPGTYSGLSLTFANPQLVIYNSSDTAIAGTCAVGSICQLTPAVDDSTNVNITSSPFPVTFSPGVPFGFLIDFHLDTIIQNDLSVNLGVSNGITVAQLPPVAPTGPPQFGFLNGTVASVNTSQSQFTMTTAWGNTFTIDTNSSTAYNDFPSSDCAAASISCLSAGESVQVQIASVQPGGSPLAAQVTYVQASSQQTVEGTIMGFSPTKLTLVLHSNPANATGVPLGGIATVTIANGAIFSIDANGFTLPSGAIFAGFSNLTVGQNVQVDLEPGTLQSTGGTGNPGVWAPPPAVSFTTNSVRLEPGQFTGTITGITSPDFTLNTLIWPICANVCPDWVALVPISVTTTSQTVYQGFNPDNFSGLAENDVVSVNGWLIELDNGILDPAIAPPFILGQTVTFHPNETF
jgi:hypothetical protein